ncbi:MAG: bifunctional diaminohydroxyphosphoribosylaminopyrimidine deaminase/5-amino-6-(5-phosphoribosylamino)uracil reductase RibD [Bacteroidetes bacterium]|nr:bifunctional diaminohydroxyphosphoribosylaminopyrimidine deaminase/5-amino-6-(5-phosphoribosylamino)uracil reductase RibD [Bacteroidota bacterium]
MHRSLFLAQHGLGQVQPNPLVGAVVVHDGKIIGEGWHREFGGPHAEVNAINAVKDKSLLSSSTLYVNLEPCCHYGKTPPCTELIIKNRIPEVIIGTEDPYPEVAGKGIAKLKEAGIRVVAGVLEKECRHLNRRFFTYHEKKRPYVILKWAQSRDGFIGKGGKNEGRQEGKRAGMHETGEQQRAWISSEISLKQVHKWRSEEQAILVGTKTAITDNPQLTVRKWAGKNPVRILIDRNLVVPPSSRMFDSAAHTLIFNGFKNEPVGNIEWIKIDFTAEIIPQIFNILFEKKIQSIIIEGGTFTLNSFLETGLWDEARIFVSGKYFKTGVSAPAFPGTSWQTTKSGEDDLMYFYRTAGH